ncbi:hypothetical protein GCM10010873_06500 [Cypionkella aquatica]|uniref:Uncharacterized protein n=1 Tax=Cypionkella aquatica TaxID=1756042 RepID=A0AA37TVX7_9RHOB|nr:hypothetical protein [Cypionkella aquatica]GLS85677.1 hypothetical protein GCM10010873_06500 [Cypionkella aquatica]
MRYILPLLLLASPAVAADLATGDAIRAAISGNTVSGSMSASGAYGEFYAADGTIRAADYTGTWAVKGDKMCFTYGQDPENCWSVAITGSHVVWMSETGEEGHGSIKPGNPGGW